MMDGAEQEPNPFNDKNFCGAYLIRPLQNGFWSVCEFKNCQWHEDTKNLFENENMAFNYAYKKYCDNYNKIFK